MLVHIDLETRSVVDLGQCGVYVYATHPSTQILVCCYAINDAPVATWRPLTEPMPADLVAVLTDPATRYCAHNASFERILLSRPPGQRIGFPARLADVTLWDCTAARAAAIGLPRSLAGASAALGLPVQKDQGGRAVMLQMCKPRHPRAAETAAEDMARDYATKHRLPPLPPSIYWYEDEDRFTRLATYCVQDVEVERALDRVLPPLRPEEHACWELTERMNDRGVLVDTALVEATARLIDGAEEMLSRDIAKKTNDAVPRISDSGALGRWLTAQGIDDHIDADSRKASVAKGVVEAMIANPDLDPLVRQVLQIRKDGGGSSAKKWRAIRNYLGPDGRARGALVYCGAASTQRWSSRGIQLQNLPRNNTVKQLSQAVDDVTAGACAEMVNLIYGPPMIVASEMLRPAFIAPPGSLLARGDYSQIEARVTPWLAGAEWKLDAFRAYDAGTGPDLYKVAAAGIYRCKPEAITPDQRQTGKVSELALGFGGGAGALQAMAKMYRMTIPQHPRDPAGKLMPGEPEAGTDEWIKRSWRQANPEIVALWKGMESAALDCMRLLPGVIVPVWTLDRDGDPKHRVPLSFSRNARALRLELPSGRGLFYWTPRLRKAQTPWGERWTIFFRAEDAVTRQWAEFNLWGGLAAQNAVQAVARDVMRDALLRLYSQGILPVLTVHDEAVCEVVAPDPKAAAAIVTAAMAITPDWAPGLPIAADSSAGPRYLKV